MTAAQSSAQWITCLLCLQAALECAVEYTGKREAFGAPIGKLQAIQVIIIMNNNIIQVNVTAGIVCSGRKDQRDAGNLLNTMEDRINSMGVLSYILL